MYSFNLNSYIERNFNAHYLQIAVVSAAVLSWLNEHMMRYHLFWSRDNNDTRRKQAQLSLYLSIFMTILSPNKSATSELSKIENTANVEGVQYMFSSFHK